MIEQALEVLPPWVRQAMEQQDLLHLEEVRLRIGQPPFLNFYGRETALRENAKVTAEDLQYILSAASGGSAYAVNHALCEGFLTIRGGHRLGVCGTAVSHDGGIQTVKEPSSLSLRIARETVCAGFPPSRSTLILGPPGCGKTTMLRDCIRLLSDERDERVSLVDERGEVAAVYRGEPQLCIGRHTDVLTGADKKKGIDMVLRSMNPQWIAVDEITQAADVVAMERISYCGVKVLATAHADSATDLHRRPVYQKLLRAKIFRDVVVMDAMHGYKKEVLP